MKALYSRKELYHISFKDATVPAERYLFKFENQRKEISKLKLHEKDFLFRVMRTLYKSNGKKKYNIFDIEELKECLFYWIILLHSNMTMVFDGFVPGLKNNPMSEKEKHKNKRFFNKYLRFWKSQIESGKGPYYSILKPTIHQKLKSWQDLIRSKNLPVELWKQKEVYVYACFFNIYYHVKLYFDELLHPYVLRQINGVDVSSMLAGVGIASVIIGLAVQDALKDIIRGFNILSDHYFVVGDVVTYGEFTGKVLVIGLRTTKIQDIATDNVISIANRNIEQIQVVSRSLYVNFPMPYELPVDTAEEVIKEIMEEISKGNEVEEVEYKGVKELAESSIKYLLKITCPPERRLQVGRDVLGCILRVLEKNNIQVPYNQIDVHQK